MEEQRWRVVLSFDLVGALIWAMIAGGILILAVVGIVCLLR